MLRFLIGRAGGAMVVLAVMSFVIFAMIGLMPGDPIENSLEALQRLRMVGEESYSGR